MALTHTHMWRTTDGMWHQAIGMYIWNAGAWVTLKNHWVSDGSAFQHGFTTTDPGPLATIEISPDNASYNSLDTTTYTAVGRDADGLGVSFTPVWSINTLSDSINSVTGDFVANFIGVPTPYSGVITCTNGGAISDTTPFSVVT